MNIQTSKLNKLSRDQLVSYTISEMKKLDDKKFDSAKKILYSVLDMTLFCNDRGNQRVNMIYDIKIMLGDTSSRDSLREEWRSLPSPLRDLIETIGQLAVDQEFWNGKNISDVYNEATISHKLNPSIDYKIQLQTIAEIAYRAGVNCKEILDNPNTTQRI